MRRRSSDEDPQGSSSSGSRETGTTGVGRREEMPAPQQPPYAGTTHSIQQHGYLPLEIRQSGLGEPQVSPVRSRAMAGSHGRASGRDVGTRGLKSTEVTPESSRELG
jgi:hypothetical protein